LLKEAIMNLRWSLLFLLLSVAGPLGAQSFRGTILGTVTDSQGAVVAGAKITAHNIATGLDRSTETSADGSYAIPELPIGSYKVTVSQSGFQTAVTNDVAVDVGAEKRVDAVLKTGQVTTVVEVSGEVLPLTETTTDTLGNIFTAAQAKDLPLNGRDFQKMIFLTPGVAGSPDEITDSPGSFGIFSMNGARGRSNNFLLDGTDMNDGYRNDPAINEAGVFGTPATILPVDAIEETQVVSNFMPEYGRNAGATVNIVTKSGTNSLHGTFFEYFRNNALDARNYFNSSSARAPFHNNQFGGSLGGPIIKDKTFFYLDYEGQRERVGVVTLACVPEGSGPGGALSPADATDPVIAALITQHNPWPAPNRPGIHSTNSGCPNGPNASLISPSYNNLTSAIAKIDHNFNSTNLLTGRYFIGDSSQAFPLALTASGGQLPGFNTVTPTRVQLVAISYVHTFGATKVNEMRYGWNRFAEGFFPQDAKFDPSSIGLCNTSDPTSCHASGLPIILVSPTLSGSSSFFAQPGSTSGDPRSRVDSNNQFVDNFSWKLNKHDLKFGFEFRRTSIQQRFDKYSRGRLRFADLSHFLSGSLKDAFQYKGNTLRHTFENNYGLYFQDTFRLTPRLTFNYGLRWDYFGVVAEKNNLFSVATNLDPVAQTFTLTMVGQSGLSRLYEPDYRNFAPRTSIAWDVTGKSKTVVRAGWGMFYDAFSQDFFLGHLPYPTFYDPGPAYNPVGPAQVLVKVNTSHSISSVPLYDPTTGCVQKECDVFTVDRHIRTPYMENYNLNIQHQIGKNLAVQVGYVGSQGHRLFRFRDLNQPGQAAITASDIAFAQSIPGCFPNGGPGCLEGNSFGVPRVYGGVFGDNNPFAAYYLMQEEATAKSNYNALQTSLRLTNWRGITSIVNYSWSKSLDTASDGEDFENNAAQPNDSTRPNLEYGPSNFNVPHRFSWVFGYDLPKSGSSKLRNGWGFSSTAVLQSGQPFQMNYNFEDDFSGSGEGDDRPDIVGPIVYHKRNPANYIQLSSFAIPCTITTAAQASPTGLIDDCIPGTRHFGNQRRNSLVGPTFKQWDFAVYKTTALSERLSVQLRAEFFNILNHPNFANPLLPAFVADPGSNLGACSCGLQSIGNREVGNAGYQIVATGDVGVGNPFLGGGGPRGIQLAAKFTF
jgi:Carboxypeptidase regulatory-like domain/TonB dependent receptor/TonB-dependent Receptor Plug Domain